MCLEIRVEDLDPRRVDAEHRPCLVDPLRQLARLGGDRQRGAEHREPGVARAEQQRRPVLLAVLGGPEVRVAAAAARRQERPGLLAERLREPAPATALVALELHVAGAPA